jgi:hypothetical protein
MAPLTFMALHIFYQLRWTDWIGFRVGLTGLIEFQILVMIDQELNADCINRFQTNLDGNICRKEDNLGHSTNRARWHEFIPTVDQAGHTCGPHQINGRHKSFPILNTSQTICVTSIVEETKARCTKLGLLQFHVAETRKIYLEGFALLINES